MISPDYLKEEAEKCVRCGMCQSVCPVFAELWRETAVARGKVSLIQKMFSGEIRNSRKLSTHLLQCLGCGACAENCANGVRPDELILAMRASVAEEDGLSFPKRLILRRILNSLYLLPMLVRTGSLLQGLILKKVPNESGLRLRFSLPYLDKERLIPPIATPFLLNQYPDLICGENERKKVGLFVGCSINYLFPSVGESTIGLLTQSNLSVALPKDQICCGLPAYGSGDLQTARSLAARNIEAFGRLEVDHLLAPCASCFYFLKEWYPMLFPGDEKARTFSQKVIEPSILFSSLLDFSDLQERYSERKLRLTYHDPCHLRRGMKIYQEPRQLLRSLPGIEFVEMKQADRCCGMGGSFNFIYYDLSKRILQTKLDNIETAKVDGIVTSCMGCIMQLRDGIYQRRMGIPVVHLTEVLSKLKNSSLSGLLYD